MQAASMIDESAKTTFFTSVPIDSSLILFRTFMTLNFHTRENKNLEQDLAHLRPELADHWSWTLVLRLSHSPII